MDRRGRTRAGVGVRQRQGRWVEGEGTGVVFGRAGSKRSEEGRWGALEG